ncbi:hypothetical protein ZWY2020_036448 [Hordeum vulgare]|nr:hypothetical protein ZWY2020_036448 [Hordeum vulgare]
MGVLVFVDHLRGRHKRLRPLDRHDGDGHGVLYHMCTNEAERAGHENGQHPTFQLAESAKSRQASRPESASARVPVSAVAKVPCQSLDPIARCTRSSHTQWPVPGQAPAAQATVHRVARLLELGASPRPLRRLRPHRPVRPFLPVVGRGCGVQGLVEGSGVAHVV